MPPSLDIVTIGLIDEGEIPGVTANASLKLSTGWAWNRCFACTFGTAAVLVQGGGRGGVHGNQKEGVFGAWDPDSGDW